MIRYMSDHYDMGVVSLMKVVSEMLSHIAVIVSCSYSIYRSWKEAKDKRKEQENDSA
ncbi:hypothetical protein [Bacillus thermotolerans]|uniref:hypothetical protein n=1 Tax=Bacillus thermotolerans TaxID=1221996 RepID=UPI0012EE17F0|nr:hypothetical protein [Bacillus thermotolerans]